MSRRGPTTSARCRRGMWTRNASGRIRCDVAHVGTDARDGRRSRLQRRHQRSQFRAFDASGARSWGSRPTRASSASRPHSWTANASRCSRAGIDCEAQTRLNEGRCQLSGARRRRDLGVRVKWPTGEGCQCKLRLARLSGQPLPFGGARTCRVISNRRRRSYERLIQRSVGARTLLMSTVWARSAGRFDFSQNV